MGWWAGEWVEGQACEDAPCCGCCGAAVQAADDRYLREREYEHAYDDTFDDDSEEDTVDDDDSDYWQAEDSALEESLFGDC